MMDELTPERCRELAARPMLDVADWIDLTGAGTGEHVLYVVDETGVRFRSWDADFIEQAPVGWQGEMCRQNATPMLAFPCSPSEMVAFVDGDFVGVFGLPDEFVGEVHRLQIATESDAQRARADELDRLAEELGSAEPATKSAEPVKPQPAATLSSSAVEYLPKSVIVTIFAQIVMTEDRWRQMLGDKRSSLAKSCSHIPGRKGKNGASQWNPLDVARWVLGREDADPRKINRIFMLHPMLEPWRDEWVELYEMYRDDL